MRTRNLRAITLSLIVTFTLLGALAACTSSAPVAEPEVATEVPATEAAPTEAVVTEAAATETPTSEVEAASETPEATEPSGEEATSDQATLIVQLDNSRTVVREVDFIAPISGLALLEASGLEVGKAEFDWGTAVCSIEGVGCPTDDCFCNDNAFWNYLTWEGDSWAGYPVGAAQSVISETGAIEGWHWSNGATSPEPANGALAAQAALTWLRSQQVITDGSYSSSAASSVEALLSISANHEDATLWRPAADAPSLLDFVVENGAAYAQSGVSEAGKLAVALAAADACWPVDALKPSDYYSETIGALHADAGPLAWGILGTLALDEEVPTDSVDYLLGLALPEGGWEWAPGWGRDTNSTALAVQALVASGVPVTDSVVISGQAYLLSAQTDEGGFSYDPHASWGNIADANSTAYTLQGLAALGIPAPEGAIDYLVSLQGEDGALGWQTAQPEANAGSTQQAIPALLGQSYPLVRVALPLCE